MLGAALALMVVAVAAVGILGTRAATSQGNEIAGDEPTTAVVTGQLGRSMDAAYAAGLAAVQASVPAERSRLLGSLYTNLLPAVDARLVTLDQLHADDRRPSTPTSSGSAGSGPRSGPCSARRACRPHRRWPPPTPRSAPTSAGCSSASSTTPAPTTPTRTPARSGPSP